MPVRDLAFSRPPEDAALDTRGILEAILDSGHLKIAYLDRNLGYVRVNRSYAEMHNMRPEELAGRSYFELHQDPENEGIIRRVMETGKPLFAAARRSEPRPGSTGASSYWDWSLMPVSDQGGSVSGLVLVLQDVTDRVEAQEALGRSQEQLLQAQKMDALGVLVAGVAHEINNPINQIIFNTPLLQRVWEDMEPVLDEAEARAPGGNYGGLPYEFLKENMRQLLSNMDMAANRIARIVTDLKNFSRRSNAAERIPVDLNTAVENAVRLTQTTLRKSGVNLVLDLSPDLPPVNANLQNLEQITLNLLINAVQAVEGRPEGRVRISTGLNDGKIILGVSDNGNGVPESIAGRAFDPFVTDRQAQGGTGLGLSVTYNLVKAHSGDISFDSRPGQGTTFNVRFPVNRSVSRARPFRGKDPMGDGGGRHEQDGIRTP